MAARGAAADPANAPMWTLMTSRMVATCGRGGGWRERGRKRSRVDVFEKNESSTYLFWEREKEGRESWKG